MIPKVDTFAHDISEEVKAKEASLTQIATASNDIGNKDVSEERNSNRLILSISALLIVLIMIVIGVLFYVLKEDDVQISETESVQITEKEKRGNLSALSPTLDREIGIHIQKVEKKDKGYVLTLSSYSPVFAYMKRNGSEYIIELANALNKEVASSTKKVNEPKTQTATTSTATTSTQLATSTKATSTPPTASTTIAVVDTVISAPTNPWSDVTSANVTMRVFREGNTSVVYAFVSPTQLIIAPNETSVLAIKSVILK
ncbi:MAG: hypothetical protein RI935_202 [Candidatus Parcubacteria bacterium]|jgi:hypothetical protein